MENKAKSFHTKSEIIAFDRDHRSILNNNIDKYDHAVTKGRLFYSNLGTARDQASKIKDYCLQEIEHLLVRFERNARDKGCEVEWAATADDVFRIVRKIIETEGAKTAVKMRSMVSEEIGLNKILKDKLVDAFESDLGEFIVTLAEEKPYHMLTPAIHKTKEAIAELFNQKFDLGKDAGPEKITAFVREFMREKFINADIGITGANFLVAETGSVCLTENAGNGMMTFSWPKTLIVIAGLEKVIPEIDDLDLFWPLLAVHGTGQNVTAYNTILSGPAKITEGDGPGRMIVILFDGGRTTLFQDPGVFKALKCIRCGACLNACPVYKNIGGHAYQTTYAGPVGSVISMYLDGSKDAGFLNFASTLCGKCTEVCPVNIPLHNLLLLNRKNLAETVGISPAERFFFHNYRKVILRRKRLERIRYRWKHMKMKHIGEKAWGPRRASLVFAKESFHETWKKMKF